MYVVSMFTLNTRMRLTYINHFEGCVWYLGTDLHESFWQTGENLIFQYVNGEILDLILI
jgi:hypothetical protein